MPEAEKFSSHLPAVLAATTVTVLASLGTSYLGWTGTLTGVVAASLITGGGAWWVERALRRSAARTRALAEARRHKGRPLNPAETSYIAAVTDQQDERKHRGIPWKTASLSAGIVLAAAVAVIAFIELGTGKPVSAVVRGDQNSHGFLVPVTPAATPAAPATTAPAARSPAQSVQPTVPVTAAPSPSPSLSATPSPSAVPPTAPVSPTSTAPPGTPPASPSAFSPSSASGISPDGPPTG